MYTHSHTNHKDTKFPSVNFPWAAWCTGIGQAYNQLAVFSSCGCQLACISLVNDQVYDCFISFASCPPPLLTTLLTTSNLIVELLLTFIRQKPQPPTLGTTWCSLNKAELFWLLTLMNRSSFSLEVLLVIKICCKAALLHFLQLWIW